MVAHNNFVDNIYIVTLRIIQPARVQDVFDSAKDVFGDEVLEKISKDEIYASHKRMLESGMICKVRKGTYCLDHKMWGYARSLIKHHSLDNKRFFLLKKERKGYHR